MLSEGEEVSTRGIQAIEAIVCKKKKRELVRRKLHKSSLLGTGHEEEAVQPHMMQRWLGLGASRAWSGQSRELQQVPSNRPITSPL